MNVATSPWKSRNPDLAGPALATLLPIEERSRRRELARRRWLALHAFLGRRSYGRVWVPHGEDDELAAQLARLATHLWVTVTPASSEAVTRIVLRCAQLPNVSLDLSGDAPAAQRAFDLIIVSGFDTYPHPAELVRAAGTLVSTLAPGGELVAVHALGCGAGTRGAGGRRALYGDAVHHLLLEHLPLHWRDGTRDGEFRLDAWVR
jgi:hypothetical protein